MTCADVNGLLDRLMDGELTDEERRAMEAHGRECPDCAEAIRATTRMKALFDEMEPEADVPLAAQAKWRGAVREAARQKKRARLIRWVGSAAAAVVVLAGVGLAMNLRGAPARDAQKSASAQLVEVEAAGEADEAAENAVDFEAEVPEEAATDGAPAAAPMSAQASDAAEENDAAFEAAPMSIQASDSAEENDAAFEAAPMSVQAAEEIDAAFEAEPIRDMAAESAKQAEPVMEFAAEAHMSAQGADEADDADAEEFSDADGAVLETDGETMGMCAALAKRAPACELRLRVEDPDKALAMVCDLASEYEADTDVQFLDEGGTNIYVELPSGEAEAFLKAIEPVGTPEGEAKLSDAGAATTVLMLIELLPEK